MRTFVAVTALTLVSVSLRAADDETRSAAREALKARIAADALKVHAAKPAARKDAAPPPSAAPAALAPKSPAAAKSENTEARKEQPTVLPKVEVKKGRITELDRQLAKQEQDIAREKKNLKSSEVDNALNDAKLARPLAIFGGDSTQFRKGVASERVELMEAEKDLLEAIAHAKTKEEKAALKKQLDDLKTMRRELDRAMR